MMKRGAVIRLSGWTTTATFVPLDISVTTNSSMTPEERPVNLDDVQAVIDSAKARGTAVLEKYVRDRMPDASEQEVRRPDGPNGPGDRDCRVGGTLGEQPSARSVRGPRRQGLVRGPAQPLRRLAGPGDRGIQAVPPRRGRRSPQPDRRRRRNRFLRGKPGTAYRQARPGDRFVGFDPATEEFFSITEIGSGGGSVRHMFDEESTNSIWFGSDANTIGQANLPPLRPRTTTDR